MNSPSSSAPPNSTPASQENITPKKEWVQFNNDEDGGKESEDINAQITPSSPYSSPAAILETSTVEIVSNNVPTSPTNSAINNNKGYINSTIQNVDNLQNVDLNNTGNIGISAGRRSHTGFTNGDILVTLLPTNASYPWVTPATFRPELVPEELMVPGLTLTVEEFVHSMEMLTSDFRFNTYTICYKRLLAAWLSTAFLILLIILFSGAGGIGLFALGISWLIINAGAVFLCMWIKIKINQGLERCMARVNKQLIKHKILVGLDDRGRVSCHKVHLCFIYFDSTECIKRLDQLLDSSGENRVGVQRQLDSSDVEIVISGGQHANSRRIPQKQRGSTLFLRYVQRWAKDYLRRRLDWTVGEGSENPSSPRHLTSALCPCQYVEEYLREKMSLGQLQGGGGQRQSAWCPCSWDTIVRNFSGKQPQQQLNSVVIANNQQQRPASTMSAMTTVPMSQ